MAQDIVINGTTYPAVESVALTGANGDVTMFYPDAVRYVEQALTDEQKAQARANIGAMEASLVDFSMFEQWGVVGDSFANGHIVIDDSGKQYPNVSWGQILARKCGNTCTLFAQSGLTTKTWLTSEHGLNLLKATDPLQLYVLVFGINDAKLGTDYLGTTADIETHADTFYGNYARIIDEIRAYAPAARLILSTIASQENNYPAANGCIANLAQHYGIPLVVQASDPYFQSDFYLASRASGHPNAIGYSGMAIAFKRMIENAMVQNSDYFATYPEAGDGGVATYHNVLKAAIGTDGSIYNSAGWVGSKRLSGSTGDERDAENCCVTGFMSVKSGDIVRLKDEGVNSIWDEQSGWAAWNVIAYYDSTFKWLGSITLQPSPYGICTADCAPTGTIANGGIVTITVPSNANIAYVRLSVASAQTSIEGLIITVNEEIE